MIAVGDILVDIPDSPARKVTGCDSQLSKAVFLCATSAQRSIFARRSRFIAPGPLAARLSSMIANDRDDRHSGLPRLDLADVRGKVDCGIMSIRTDELEAVLESLPPSGLTKGSRWYSLSRVNLPAGRDYLVAMMRTSEQGGGAAQDAARDFLEDLRPRWLLVVGIAGARPTDEFGLGDVVVSTRIHDFSVEAVLANGEREYNVTGGPLHRDAEAIAAHVTVLKQEFRGWNSTKSIRVQRPPILAFDDRFEGPLDWRKKVNASLTFHAARKKPLVVACPIACSDRLVRDGELLEVWLKMARHVCAIEMESQGVYRAAHGRVPFLAIRGISDVIGLKRDDPRWTTYACHSAAAFTRAFIRAGLIVSTSSPAQTTQLRWSRKPNAQRQSARPSDNAPAELPLPAAEGNDQPCAIEFSSLLEPDDVSIELMFQEFFRRASAVVPMTGNVRLPTDPQEWDRFCAAVTAPPIIINWPSPIAELVPKIDNIIGDVRRYRDPRSSFHGVNRSWLANHLRGLERVRWRVKELIKHAPMRLPWLWLGLLHYCGPWPDNSSSFVKVQRNYLRFSSLKLYHLLAGALDSPGFKIEIPAPLTSTHLSALRWEYSLPLFSREHDEIVVAYVTDIVGVNRHETCIYGPKMLTARGYHQSNERKPITSPWFVQYLVPQVEMEMAANSPSEPTRYQEEAYIRKVTDLSGDDLKGDWWRSTS